MRLAGTIVVAIVLCTPVRAADPFIGKWKMNISKSDLAGAQAGTAVFEEEGDGLRLTLETSIQGRSQKSIVSVKLDGKEYPDDTGAGLTVIRKRIDANVIEAVLKKDGKVTNRTRLVVSPAGKTLEATRILIDPVTGKEDTQLIVYKRQ